MNDTTGSPTSTDLLPHDIVREIASLRERAISIYETFIDQVESAHTLVDKAESLLTQLSGESSSWPYVDRHASEVKEFHQLCKLPDTDQVKRVCRRLIDLRVWSAVIQRTELEVLMDKTAKDDLRSQMAYVPERVDRRTGKLINEEEIAKSLPPATEDNILATIEQFRDDAGEIWQRGVAMAFSKLDRRFRSHDGFKIGSRIILTRAFNEYGSWNYHRQERDTLLDIERVFLVLDGRSPRESYQGIVETMDEERRGVHSPRQSEHVGDYFKVRIFKNGNAHLWFTRDDLTERVNKVLADYYGATLGPGKGGKGSSDEETWKGEDMFDGAVDRPPAKGFGLYPTPDRLAERVISEADLWNGGEALTVLEPSAGTGQLARRVVEYEVRGERVGHRVTCVEIQPELARELRGSGLYSRVLCRDFLTVQPLEIGRFDRVVMNPPFDRLRDVDHVYHALGFLKEGGRLTAIMSQSAEFSETEKARVFRETVSGGGYRATWRDLPEGSFRELGVNVNTVLLTVERVG